MPARSKRQYRAMQAAAHGRSTLGIPKSVGEEFTAGQSPKRLPERVRSKKSFRGTKHAIDVYRSRR